MSTELRAAEEIRINATVKTTGTDGTSLNIYRTGTLLLPASEHVFTNGTGTDQAKYHYRYAHSLAKSGTVTIDLTSCTGDATLGAITFSIVKRVWIRLRTPATATYVVVGGAANPFAPWLSTTSVTERVYDQVYRRNPVDGWTVAAGAKNILITEPGVAAAVVDVSIIGY